MCHDDGMTDSPRPVVRSGGLRERLRRQTRLDIANAATRLVARHGLDATTVDMIADPRLRLAADLLQLLRHQGRGRAGPQLPDGRSASLPFLDARPAGENPLVAVREAFSVPAAITPSDGPEVKAITQSDPTLKAELDRIFDAVGSNLKVPALSRRSLPARP